MLYKRELRIPRLTGRATRRCYVYLPDCYRDDPECRLPVMYMFDGHNVFLDEDATYGKSWGMGAYMDWTETPMIIVAIECNHKGNGRLSEYAPFDFSDPDLGNIQGKGKIYMDWLVGTLKPAIDKNLRTLPGRENTYICSSSMGGLMALYAAVAYNRYFQRAACLSPSLWAAQDPLSQLIAQASMEDDTILYMDYGSREIANHRATAAALSAISQQLLARNVNLTLRIVPGGDHSEASWGQQIPVFMACLGL